MSNLPEDYPQATGLAAPLLRGVNFSNAKEIVDLVWGTGAVPKDPQLALEVPLEFLRRWGLHPDIPWPATWQDRIKDMSAPLKWAAAFYSMGQEHRNGQ